jgi:hypothetical protein
MAFSQISHQELVIWETDESNEVFVLNPELLDKIMLRGKIAARVLEDQLIN